MEHQESFFADPTLWVACAFVLFIALTYKKIFAFAARALDERSAKIKAELDQARQLREEAERTLTEYRKKQAESLKEAEEILAKTHNDIEVYGKQAEAELAASMEERTKQALEKIAQVEESAIQEVRNHVVDIALAAARSIIIEHVGSMPQDELIKLAMADIERKIH